MPLLSWGICAIQYAVAIVFFLKMNLNFTLKVVREDASV